MHSFSLWLSRKTGDRASYHPIYSLGVFLTHKSLWRVKLNYGCAHAVAAGALPASVWRGEGVWGAAVLSLTLGQQRPAPAPRGVGASALPETLSTAGSHMCLAPQWTMLRPAVGSGGARQEVVCKQATLTFLCLLDLFVAWTRLHFSARC